MSNEIEWEEVLSEFEKLQRLQRAWGFKFQVTAESLLKEMRYTVIRAQHRIFTEVGEGRRGWKWYMERLGGYLWNYADYVVTKGRYVYVVEVKSQGYIPFNKDPKLDPYTPDTISFSKNERQEYSASKAPILVLLLLYNWGGKIREMTSHGSTAVKIPEYSEKPDVKHLGPLLYKLVPFSDFSFKRGDSGGSLADKFQGCEKLSSRKIYSLLKRTKAADIVRIEPGCVRREKGGRIITESLSTSQTPAL